MYSANEMQYRRELEGHIQNNRLIQIQKKLREQQQNRNYQKQAIDNFPFGRQSIKLSKYVSNQLQNKQHQENARVLEMFRRKAVSDKFTKWGNSKQRQKFITQNMLPGVTNNPSMVKQFSPQLKRRQFYSPQTYSHENQYQKNIYYSDHIRAQTIDANHLYNQRKRSSIIPYLTAIPIQQQLYEYDPYSKVQNSYINQKIKDRAKTINVDQLKRNDKKQQESIKKKYYKMKLKKSRKQLKNMQRLEKVLIQMNQKIKYNSYVLKKAVQTSNKYNKNYNQQGQSNQSKIKQKNRRRTEENPQDLRKTKQTKKWNMNSQFLHNSTHQSFHHNKKKLKPNIEYNNKRLQKSLIIYNMPSKEPPTGIQKIRQHLKLLKKHSQRLDTLHSYDIKE